MTGSVVQYDGFLTSGAATLTPALRFDTPNLSFGGQGSWTVFESGNSILQATAAAAWIAPAARRWRFELSGSAGISRYADQAAFGHALTRGRLHVFAANTGGWIGATTGASFDGSTETPVELAIGGWSVRDGVALVGSLSATWLGNDRHLDLGGAARWTMRRVELETRLGMRPFANSAGRVGDALTGLWGEVSALVPLRSHVALNLSAGSYPSDPVRGVLGAKYATAGLRIDFASREQLPALTIPPAILAAVQKYRESGSTAAARIEILSTGGSHVVRVYAAGAQSVELMGDFTDWTTTALTRAGEDTWELRIELTPGVHRLNVRINGGAWLVPDGARPEQGEFGDAVGVIVVR